MRQRKGMAPFLLLFVMMIAVGMLTGDILTDTMKTVKVEDYVCRTCSVSNSWTSPETFEQSIMFDYSIDYSLAQTDAVLYIQDSEGTKKEIFKGTHILSCQPYPKSNSPVVHTYPVDTYEFSAYDSIGSLKTLEGRPISTVSLVGMAPPYNLHVVTKASRGTVCGSTGNNYEFGIVSIGKIAVLDIEPEPEPIIMPEPEPIITPEPEPTTSPIDDIIEDIKEIIIPEGKEYVDYVSPDVPDMPITYVEPTIHPVRQFMDNIVSIAYKIKLWIRSI